MAGLAVSWAWQLLMIGTACAVAFDHGAALRRLGVPRRQFTAQVLRGFRPAVTSIRRGKTSPAPEQAGEPRGRQSRGTAAARSFWRGSI